VSRLVRQSDRWWSLALVTLSLPAGLAPFIDAGSFSSNVFVTIRDIAPLKAWGVAWMLAAAFAMHAVVAGSWRAYVIANVAVLALSTAWLMAVSWARWVEGYELTLTVVGLWLFPMAACAHAIWTPTEVTSPNIGK